jgi:hypothetical protein
MRAAPLTRASASRLGVVLVLVLVLVLVATVTGASVGARAGSAAAQRRVVHGATFPSLPAGWRAFDDDFGLLGHDGADVTTYALSWRYQPNSLGWADSMPRGAVAISVQLSRRLGRRAGVNLCARAPVWPGFPARHLPLRLPVRTRATLDGSPQIPEYRIEGRLGKAYNVDLRVDVNAPRPAPATLALARRLVAHLGFPAWPSLKSC